MAAGPEAHQIASARHPALSQNLPLQAVMAHILKTINGFSDPTESSFRIIVLHYFGLQNVQMHFR